MNWPQLDPGEMVCPIVIQQNAPTVDAFGATIPGWADLVSAMASMSTQGGREFYQARQVIPELTHEIKMHWQRGIRPSQRVKFWDAAEGEYRYFDIRFVNSDQMRVAMALHCRELVGQEVQS